MYQNCIKEALIIAMKRRAIKMPDKYIGVCILRESDRIANLVANKDVKVTAIDLMENEICKIEGAKSTALYAHA